MFDCLRKDTLQSLRSTKLPEFLWRVQHTDSHTSFDKNCNLVAKLSAAAPSTSYELRASLTRHLKWGYSRADSYFISAFVDYDTAVRWARASARHVSLYKIRTKYLGKDVMVFDVERTLERLGIQIDGRDGSGEYVFLNRIPARAIGLHERIECFQATDQERSPQSRNVSMQKTRSSLIPWGRNLKRGSQGSNSSSSTVSTEDFESKEVPKCESEVCGIQERSSRTLKLDDTPERFAWSEESHAEETIKTQRSAYTVAQDRCHSGGESEGRVTYPCSTRERKYSSTVDSVVVWDSGHCDDFGRVKRWCYQTENFASPYLEPLDLRDILYDNDAISLESFEMTYSECCSFK